MEIRYYEGEILQRGKGTALKFPYDQKTIDSVKGAINRHRQHFYNISRKPTADAVGWVPELKVWYVAEEIWQLVSEELKLKEHSLIQVLAEEAFFGKNST